MSCPPGVLTPAISVVSAIEGIQFQTGISTGVVVGISIAILVSGLRFTQPSANCGGLLSPVPTAAACPAQSRLSCLLRCLCCQLL